MQRVRGDEVLYIGKGNLRSGRWDRAPSGAIEAEARALGWLKNASDRALCYHCNALLDPAIP